MGKSKLVFLLVFTVLFSCSKNVKTNEKKEKGDKVVRILNFEELEPLLHKKEKDKIYVVNFWATWCKPCVDELPAFENLKESHKEVEVLLVSLDFPNQIEEQLIPFIKKKNIQSEVVVLDDPNQNKWINAIDKTWSGALPATIIYNNEYRNFYEQSFDELSLQNELQKFIN